MIELFEHNRAAYESAALMLAETGRAAIIHPTGTGKSFIAFKLCDENPDKTICWLSPSEYIFKTQLENLEKASGERTIDNIRFFTYARLINMSDAELREISPDYIVLDEFHRCGAQEWGRGVAHLLGIYPDVPVLGLSATAVRYLDRGRNMADELFDGNIASEMTLGEAVVRGIFAAPKYVLSVFSLNKELERYKHRVKSAKNRAVRDEAEKYLEALRRALEKADGLDVIFQKHMTERHGKYIVFCANFEHMREMMDKASEWFSAVDSEPRIYSVYSDDPSSAESFDRFKADTSDDHLRLLYCIDALNEGVHVDDVSGVILLRPTVSPIIYKQQIGRALAAGKKKNAVIFDIVLNIENLYNIGSVEEEMQVAMTYYRSLGMDDEIVNEHFKIVDELRDCREIFERLNDTLSASWDVMYEKAREYYVKNGDLKVPHRYKTEEGYSLGSWIVTQRRVRAEEQFGTLSESQIERLDEIGMVWGSFRDLSWERNFAAAKDYFKTFGNLNVPARYKSDGGLCLGAWIARLRSYRKSNIRRSYLTKERISDLDSIGMVWDVPDFLWQRCYTACLDYYKEHGNLDIPPSEVTPDGVRLGAWICGVRASYNKGTPALTAEQIKALDELGMPWNGKNDRLWEKGYNAALKYRGDHGNLDVPTSYVCDDGYRLGAWICDQREKKNMPARRRRLLDELGMIWEKPDPWETRYALVKDYYDRHGDINIPSKYKVDGMWLAKWLSEQRQIYMGNRGEKRLSDDRVSRLRALGMNFESSAEQKKRDTFESRFAEAEKYFELHGELDVPDGYVGSDGKRLDTWLKLQRRRHRDGELSEEREKRLSAIGMKWETADPWENGFARAAEYFAEHGDLNVQTKYTCNDGFALGVWIQNQRSRHNNPTKHRELTDEQISRLEAIGMAWNVGDSRWNAAYAAAAAYSKTHGDLRVPAQYKTPDGFSLGEWLRSQKKAKSNGRLSEKRAELLEAIGMTWGG